MPAIAVSEIPARLPAAAKGVLPRKGRLLVVDDEDGPRQSLWVIFKDQYEVLIEKDGASAIETAKKQRVDVALLDIRMSGMSGIELLEKLKLADDSIQVVMMTAFETTETIRQALRLRACEYINKPFDVGTMRKVVAEAMRKRLEFELGSNLDHGNEPMMKELQQAMQQMRMDEQMAQTRSEIYASIIHDMNGPLTVVSGYVQMINAKLGNAAQLETGDVDYVRERLKTITRQVSNCIEISRRYLTFLRPTPGETCRVPVNQLLADVNQLLRVHPSRLNHQLTIEPLAEDIAVRVNGTDLIQIILNLTVNALQCTTDPHTVTVEGTVLREPLDLAAYKDSALTRLLNVEKFENTTPLLKLSVRDTGPGILPEVLPRIFQPWFTTKARQGTGLGLNIVQRILRQEGGAMHVESQPGHGATFSVFLPAIALPAS